MSLGRDVSAAAGGAGALASDALGAGLRATLPPTARDRRARPGGGPERRGRRRRRRRRVAGGRRRGHRHRRRRRHHVLRQGDDCLRVDARRLVRRIPQRRTRVRPPRRANSKFGDADRGTTAASRRRGAGDPAGADPRRPPRTTGVLSARAAAAAVRGADRATTPALSPTSGARGARSGAGGSSATTASRSASATPSAADGTGSAATSSSRSTARCSEPRASTRSPGSRLLHALCRPRGRGEAVVATLAPGRSSSAARCRQACAGVRAPMLPVLPGPPAPRRVCVRRRAMEGTGARGRRGPTRLGQRDGVRALRRAAQEGNRRRFDSSRGAVP